MGLPEDSLSGQILGGLLIELLHRLPGEQFELQMRYDEPTIILRRFSYQIKSHDDKVSVVVPPVGVKDQNSPRVVHLIIREFHFTDPGYDFEDFFEFIHELYRNHHDLE